MGWECVGMVLCKVTERRASHPHPRAGPLRLTTESSQGTSPHRWRITSQLPAPASSRGIRLNRSRIEEKDPDEQRSARARNPNAPQPRLQDQYNANQKKALAKNGKGFFSICWLISIPAQLGNRPCGHRGTPLLPAHPNRRGLGRGMSLHRPAWSPRFYRCG